ncbi:MAG: hypothetical protein ACREQM_04190 [Candidatus Dormibacteraceae bacterium]
MGDGMADDQGIAHRLSKGLGGPASPSRDHLRAPRPWGPQPCTMGDGVIGEQEATLWIDDRPYHARCGQELERSRAAAEVARLRERLRGR